MYEDLRLLVPINEKPNYDALMEQFPSLSLLATTPQDAYYHAEGDVWTHTKMVIDELIKSEKYQSSTEEDRFIMFYSALLHDISKPACTVIEDDGRITSAGHSKRGSVDTRILLWKKEVPFEIRENICNIIATHQVPFFAFKPAREGDTKPHRSPEYIARQLSWQLPLHLLIEVARADMRGRLCDEAKTCLDDIELFEMLAFEDGCLYEPKEFPDSVTRMKYFQSYGAIDPHSPFYRESGSQVFVLSGLPATGKNEWVKNNYPNLPVLSFDDAKEELGIAHGKNPGAAVHMVTDQAKKLLAAKEPFVWNATHIANPMRQKTLNLLYQYGAEVTIVYLEVPEHEIKRRNTSRNTTLPNEKIDEMLFRWDVPTAIESHHIIFEPSHGYKNKNKRKP